MLPGVYIGTAVFLILGVFSCFYFSNYSQRGVTNAIKRNGNRQVALITCTIATFGTWIIWVSTYMHQMYPLITPILEHCDGCPEEHE